MVPIFQYLYVCNISTPQHNWIVPKGLPWLELGSGVVPSDLGVQPKMMLERRAFYGVDENHMDQS